MFGIDKICYLHLLLRISSPQVFTIYNIQALRKLLEDFQENIVGGVILGYDRYSDQSVCNLTTLEFSEETFKNEWLWTAASEQYEIAACNVIGILLLRQTKR